MNSAPDNFDRLQRLLKWKRHEQPPPGYFNELADRVIARLDRMNAPPAPSWWQTLLARLEIKPVLVGASGVVLCGLMLFGISVSQIDWRESTVTAKSSGAWWTVAAGLPTSATAWSAMPVPLATASLSSMAPVIKEQSAPLVSGNTEYELTPVSFSLRIR
jgi:hypothetical protein